MPLCQQQNGQLRKHTAQKHARKDDVFSCNFCEYSTARKCDLVKRQKTHVVKDKDEMFECEICKKNIWVKEESQ